MEPLAVIKDFDPFKDGGTSFSSSREVTAVDQTAFERAPKTFHQRIVIAVAATAHAGDYAPPGRVVDDIRRWRTARHDRNDGLIRWAVGAA